MVLYVDNLKKFELNFKLSMYNMKLLNISFNIKPMYRVLLLHTNQLSYHKYKS